MARNAPIDLRTTTPVSAAMPSTVHASSIRMKDLPIEQQKLVERTNLAATAIPRTEISSLQDKLTNSVTIEEGTDAIKQAAINAGITSDKDPFETLAELKKKHSDALNLAKLRGDRPRINYLTQMSVLIAQLSTLLNQWTSRDNARIHEKKTQYGAASTKIQDGHTNKAFWNMGFGFVSVAINLTAQGISGPFDHFTRSFNDYLNAMDTKPQQENSLTLQELQKLNDSASSNNAVRDQALQLFNLIREWAKSAGRS